MKSLPVAVAAATILLATVACGGSPDEAAATDQLPDQQTDRMRGGPGGEGFPGATGEIAAIDGATLQVQNRMQGQVAVTYTGATTFTAEVAATAADLRAGDCVMVVGEGDETVAATSVRITPEVDGSCEPAGRGGQRFSTGVAPSERPKDAPTSPPGDGPRMVMMGGAFGKVTTVSSAGFTVESTLPGQDEATTREITTSAETTWTDTVTATAEALEVGACVVAEGEKDDVGAVRADTIEVSDPVDGECMVGGVRRLEAGAP